MQSNSKSAKLHDWEVLENVAPYLNISDLMKTATLSKQYNYTLRNFVKKHLLPKESITTGQNQLSVAKKLFHRQLKIYNFANDQNNQKFLIPNLILKDIQVGSSFSLLETIQGKKLIVKNAQLLEKNFEIKTFVELQKKYSSKFVNLVGDFLYTVIDNKLFKLALKQEQEVVKQDSYVEFQTEISEIKVSQTHIFVVTSSHFHENKLFAVHLKEFKSVQVKYEQQGNQSKQLSVQKLTVAANTAYYISNFKVFELDIENSKEPKIMKSLKDKQIRKIINGAQHFFAIQKVSKLTEQWDTKDLVQWAYKEGYQDYIKIFKSEKVTGKILLSMEKRYMQDVLGIVSTKVQQRLMVQLQECNHQKQQNCTVYGWGRNEKSQLGLNPSNPVSNPHKVVLPEGFSYLKCFGNITLIHNRKSGRICMNSATENKTFEWKQIFELAFNIWSISSYKDLIMVLCPVEKDRVSQNLSQVPVHHKKQKLRTAKNIVDKISWDQNIDKKQFRVGYLDKYTGVLEIPFEQFLVATEIKEYRIQYFKRNGEIVWSKKDRIDIL